MPERSSISQSVQIGVESTPGTAVAANKRLGSIGFTFSPQTEVSAVRPQGNKYASLQVLGKEWTEADIEGSPFYSELQYLFSSLLSTPTVTQIMDGATATGAYTWVFNSTTFGDDNPKTLTVEQGSSVRAHRASHGLVSSLTFGWSREEVTLEGTLLAKAIEDGIALTANPTGVDPIPVRPTELSIYLDNSAANLGQTKLLRALEGEVSINDRYTPVWVVDAAQDSFAATVESEPEVEFTLTQMADAQGMANLDALRNGTTKFLRIEAVGPVIYTPGTGEATRHRLRIDMAGQVTEVGEFDDADGVYAIEWTFGAVHNPTWGKAFQVELITNVSAL